MKNNRDILKRALALFYPTALIGLLILLILYSKYRFNIGVVCPFKAIFDWDCPGCGGTRMAVAILQGNFYQAFRWNPFIFITAPVLAVIFIYQSYLFIFKNKIINWLDIFLIAYAILLIAFGILRNISMFSWLAPTLI